MSTNAAAKGTARKVRPLWGRGMATVPASRPTHSLDLFDTASDEDGARQHRLRCQAAQQFINGTRTRPEVLECELNAGTLLGSDAFDMQFDRGGLLRRCG